MKCHNCQSDKIRKNGHRRGKQNYHCKECDRQFIDQYTKRGYSKEVKETCLKMYVNGLGFRAIERLTGVNHNTVIRWVRKSALALPNAPQVEEIPEITEIEKLQTYVAQKKAARPRAADRRKGTLAKTTKYGYGQRLITLYQAF